MWGPQSLLPRPEANPILAQGAPGEVELRFPPQSLSYSSLFVNGIFNVSRAEYFFFNALHLYDKINFEKISMTAELEK